MAVDFAVFTRIDYWSLTSVPLDLDFDGRTLASGTGFFYAFGEQTFLVTAWHVVSGRHFQTGQSCSTTGAWPNHVTIWWNPDGRPGYPKTAQRLPLYSIAGEPLWTEIREKSYWVDVAIMPVEIPTGMQAYQVNEMPQENMSSGMGSDVFILGYPLPDQPLKLPVWKRGSLASEPAIPATIQPYWLVDTASRSGMSGAPVINRRYPPGWSFEQSMLEFNNPGLKGTTTFEGVYSGRLKSSVKEDAQLGIVWPFWWIARLLSKRLGEKAYKASLQGELERGVRVLRAYKAALENGGRSRRQS